MPLKNYGLKAVANWIGFKWKRSGTDGAKALLWWRQWRGSGKGKRGHVNKLRNIFEYNQDDCLATLEVALWLIYNDS